MQMTRKTVSYKSNKKRILVKRILFLCRKKAIEKQFKNDIEEMYRMYGIEEVEV